jgi:hypothetical protein
MTTEITAETMLEESDDTIERRFRSHQITQLVFALVMVILPFFLAPAYPGEDRVAICNWRVPALCPHQLFYNQTCPGCGLIRSFTAFAHGQFTESYNYHRLGIPLYFLILMQIPLRLYLLKKGPEKLSGRVNALLQWPIPITIAALIINWLIP